MYGKSTIYKVLSRCFCYPDQNFIHYAAGDLCQDLESSLRERPYAGEIQESLELFQSALAERLARRSLEDWKVKYTGVFIYSRDGRFCPPYESAWTENNKRLVGESTMAVKRSYGNFRLRVARSFADLPNHLAAELEFLHFLSRNEAKFEADGNSQGRGLLEIAQLSFLEGHLQKWAPRIAECLKANSNSRFFTVLARLTADFLTAETKYLKGEGKAETKTRTPAMDMPFTELDTSTLTVLEADETSPESKAKWVYATLPERFPGSPIRVKVVDGIITEVQSREDLPFFHGKQEVRGFAPLAQLYAIDKLKFPLKRVGERGQGRFKRISWDEALSEIAAVLKKHRDEGNAKTVAFFRTHPPQENMFNHFTHSYGTPNDLHTSTTSCYADGGVADVLTGGTLGEDDYLNAKYALYIGHNLLNGIRSLPEAGRFAEGIRRGMKFVFVDPRLNEGSYTNGAEWVPIKPGTDAAFVLGLMNVIVKERLYDEEFLLKRTNAAILIKRDRYPLKNQKGDYLVWDTSVGNLRPLGEAVKPSLQGTWEVELDGYRGSCKTAFQLLAERVEEYPPEEASRITTIGKERIQKIARDLGTMKPHVCIFSRQNVSAQYSNSLQYCRARNVLMCLLGILDKPGGKYYGRSGPGGIKLNKGADFRIPIRTYPMTADRADFDPTVHPYILTTLGTRYPLGVIQNFLKAIKTGEPYPIKVLFLIGCDMRAAHSPEWKEAFKKVDFIVKSHVWPDDDVDYADIVLPEATYLERDDGFEVVTALDPEDKDAEFTFLAVTPKVVEPQFEERPWTDYIKELAQRIGFGESYDFSLDEYWNFLLAPTGIDMDYLRKEGVYCPTPLGRKKVEFGKKERWATDTGRLNLYGCEMADRWHKENQNPLFDPLPIYHPTTVQPAAENEFYLINGKCSYFWCNYYRDNPMLLERYLEGNLGNTLLWINARRAALLGIRDRDWVWIESEATGMKSKVRAKVTEGIHPTAVWHVYGYGHKSSLMDKDSRAREGINVNDFVPERNVPWTAGQAHCEAVVKIYKDRGEGNG